VLDGLGVTIHCKGEDGLWLSPMAKVPADVRREALANKTALLDLVRGREPEAALAGLAEVFSQAESVEQLETFGKHWADEIAKLPEDDKVKLRAAYQRQLATLTAVRANVAKSVAYRDAHPPMAPRSELKWPESMTGKP
jgi:hypothetical protein